MQVLLVNNQYQLGGAETVVQQLWSRIPDSRLLVAETTSPLPEVMYPRWLNRLAHSRLNPWIERWFPSDAWTEGRFKKLVNDPAEIVHIHNFHGFYASVQALAKVAKVKRVVWTFHGLWGVTGGCDHPKACGGYLNTCGHCPQLGLWPIGPVDRTAEALASKKAALADLSLDIIVPSLYFREVVKRSPVGRNWRIHHIPNGIDAQGFMPGQSQDGKLRALVVNRNFKDPHKGFEMVRQALRTVDPKMLQITLIGDNSDWAAQQLQPGFEVEAVAYLKNRQDLANFYGRSHLFLFASPAENFPCVILESMASGCCVVATPSGGVAEQIQSGVTGLLAADISGQALGEALGQALSNPQNIQRFGREARRSVMTNFSEDQMIEEHLKLYRSVTPRPS